MNIERENIMTTPQNIKTGDIFRGLYMGSEFTGTVTSVSSNQSGWTGDENHARVSIKVNADVMSNGWARRKAGEEIVMDCARVAGGLVRNDPRFTNLRLRRG
jgi:hypothetical protein